MAVLEKIDSFKVIGLTAFGNCNLYHHGLIQDHINNFGYEFRKKQIYGIIGEFGNGSAALSCAISGKLPIQQGNFFINGKEVKINNIKKIGCYVGEDIKIKTKFGFIHRTTVKEQIEYGVNKQKSFVQDVNKIKTMFHLSDERFNRNIKYFSGERWKASIAIGYALGKMIYCFPWMNTKDLFYIKDHIALCLESLMQIDAIIIIPTCKEEVLLEISNSCEFIYI